MVGKSQRCVIQGRVAFVKHDSYHANGSIALYGIQVGMGMTLRFRLLFRVARVIRGVNERSTGRSNCCALLDDLSVLGGSEMRPTGGLSIIAAYRQSFQF